MTKARLVEMIDSVLAWGADHDEEFRGCLVDALDITEEEYKELFDADLSEYLGEDDDEDDEDDDMDFDDAMDILDELELDDTAYDYYKEALEGIYYNDQASHETHGYESLSDVIADARSCEEINADEEDDEELTDEDYEDQFGSEMAIRICRANNIPLSDIEEYGSEAYWINDGINNLQDLYDINEKYVIPTGDEDLIRDYREEILEEEE